MTTARNRYQVPFPISDALKNIYLLFLNSAKEWKRRVVICVKKCACFSLAFLGDIFFVKFLWP